MKYLLNIKYNYGLSIYYSSRINYILKIIKNIKNIKKDNV